MNPIHNASSALVQYLDSLLRDEGTQPNMGELVVNNVGHAEEPGQAVSGDEVDTNTLELLFFKVGEIPLAISREIIAEVVAVRRSSLEPVTSKDGIFIWQLKYKGQDVGILDGRDIFLPEGHPARQVKDDGGNAYILMLKGAGYGLMCDHVGDAVDLGRQEVEWRLQRASRLWLAGMVKSYNHALLDEKEIVLIADRVLNSSH